MESQFAQMSPLQMLEWQIAMGADEAILEAPVNRYEVPQAPAQPMTPRQVAAAAVAAPRKAAAEAEVDAAAEARKAASAAKDLEQLAAALAGFEHCELRRGARNLVFADGLAGARVMIVGEGPGREEDLKGLPFVGPAGQMLDRMFAAIGLSRSADSPAEALYITNTVPWRPPSNREPTPAEIAMMQPFLARHIELAAPQVLVALGNISCQALLGHGGITRNRGTWGTFEGRPVLPMFHPAYLLRRPAAKREAWADLLALKARLKELS